MFILLEAVLQVSRLLIYVNLAQNQPQNAHSAKTLSFRRNENPKNSEFVVFFTRLGDRCYLRGNVGMLTAVGLWIARSDATNRGHKIAPLFRTRFNNSIGSETEIPGPQGSHGTPREAIVGRAACLRSVGRTNFPSAVGCLAQT
jgi:hypothetical protein